MTVKLSTLLVGLSLIATSSTSFASYVPKGSWVGRAFNEWAESAAANASTTTRVAASDGAADGAGEDASAESNESERPISPESLAALMKHPTEPHYDLLRPLSGAWGVCETGAQDGGVQSVEQRFSSTDRTHLTRSVVRASDSACKTAVSETRTSYECSALDKKSVSCKAQKQESRAGGGAFAADSVSPDVLAKSDMKLTFLNLESKKKKRAKHVHAGSTGSEGVRPLEIRVNPVAGGEAQSYRLEFLPEIASAALDRSAGGTRPKKHAPHD